MQAESHEEPPKRLAALRYRDFRLVWFGEMVSGVGTQMQNIAVDWHVFQLLKDQTAAISLFGHTIELNAGALGLGTLGLVRFIPIVIFALVGGMLADTYDRRKLMIMTRLTAAIFAAVLAILTLHGQTTFLIIYIITGAIAASSAFDSPARQSLVPNLVERKDLANAVSLNTLMFQITTIGGPALAGLLIGGLGAAAAPKVSLEQANAHIGVIYALNAISFVFAIAALALIRYRGQPGGMGGGIGWKPLKEGLSFTFNSRIIWGTMLIDFIATFFSSARTMLPIIANEILHIGPVGYGLLVTAQPLGALLAGLVAALGEEIREQGKVLLISVMIYGVATALFGLANTFLLAYFLFALTGAADTVSTVIRGTIRQMLTPDHLRGRMTSVNMIFFMGGPQLGELESGIVASALGAPFAIVSGGIATVLMTLYIAWKFPRLAEYTSEKQQNAESV